MKPYYDDGSCTIYNARCEDVLPTLSGVDVVFTSPPYNQGKMKGGLANLDGGYASYADAMPQEAYEEWQRAVLRMCWDALSETGAIFYNHSPLVRGGAVWLPTVLNPDLPLRQVIVWDQVVGINWTPTHFLPLHEWVMLLAKPGFRLRDRSASHAGDVWRIRVETRKSGRSDHPASFPLMLPKRALSSLKPGLVCDPFMGGGTTLLAAKDLGHKAIGIEIDERYCEMAANRLTQEVLPLETA